MEKLRKWLNLSIYLEDSKDILVLRAIFYNIKNIII